MPTAWKGTISFGLVNIPFTLYPAFKSKEMEFHLLHRPDHGRIGYQKICKKCGKVLKPEDIVKAFEHEKDAYIPLEKEELEDPKLLNFPALTTSVGKKELDLAKQFASTLKGTFDPVEFQDTHRARLEETIQEKMAKDAKRQRGKAGLPQGGDRKVIYLMERLRESLKQGEKPHGGKHCRRKKAG